MNYILKLKNGDVIKITEEQAKTLRKAILTGDTPAFISIHDALISTNSIASMFPEKW